MTNLAFQERAEPAKPVVEVHADILSWEPPAYDVLFAYFLDKVRRCNNRKALGASDLNLIRGMVVLCREHKRKDHYASEVKWALENIKEHYGVVQ